MNRGTRSLFGLAQVFLQRRELYLCQPMNALFVGDEKQLAEFLRTSPPQRYLLIDDGPLIDELKPSLIEAATVPNKAPVAFLDFSSGEHSFNPLSRLDYRKVCDVVATFQALFPAGDNTLTKEGIPNAFFDELLQSKRPRMEKLFLKEKKDDPSYLNAKRMVKRLLYSPVLREVFCGRPNISFNRTILARTNRAELGTFDALAIGLFLISQYPSQVIVSDFAFYGRPYHADLLHQDRLLAAARTLSRLDPLLRDELLRCENKYGHNCTYADAVTLVQESGKIPTNETISEYL